MSMGAPIALGPNKASLAEKAHTAYRRRRWIQKAVWFIPNTIGILLFTAWIVVSNALDR